MTRKLSFSDSSGFRLVTIQRTLVYVPVGAVTFLVTVLPFSVTVTVRMGAALYAFCGAQLRQGIEIVTDALHLADIVADADLVITGEGRIDSQTVHGKVPVGVARVAKRYNLPVIGIAGSLTADVGVVHQHGLDAVFSVIYSVCTLEQALENAAENVRMTARNVAAVLKMGRLL